MRSPKEGIVINLLVSSMVISSLTVVVLGFDQDYPWLHYFDEPDLPKITCAFADGKGALIVSTGEWVNRSYYPNYWVEEYWSEGIFRINCAQIESIPCPDDIYVLDGAVDSQSRTWLLFAEGVDIRHYYDSETRACEGTPLDADIGYRLRRFPAGAWTRLQSYALGSLEGKELIEFPNLMDGIPGEPLAMSIDSQDRIFLITADTTDFPPLGDEFISWWYVDDPQSRRILYISEILPDAVGRDYPQFGRDGLVYLLIGYSLEAFRDKCAVLCLNPDTEDWDVYDREDSPFLDCAIEYFRVDDNNVKWFGTENGLVVFDGQNWARFTTDNSGLPYNLVRQIEYDEIDDVYHVISQAKREYYYDTAFAILKPDARSLGQSVRFEKTFYSSDTSTIYRDPHGIWWLWPFEGYSRSSTLYSYDHVRVVCWDVTSWTHLSPDSMYRGHIGAVSAEHLCLVTPTCVMIW